MIVTKEGRRPAAVPGMGVVGAGVIGVAVGVGAGAACCVDA
jgi:hypothetical protein